VDQAKTASYDTAEMLCETGQAGKRAVRRGRLPLTQRVYMPVKRVMDIALSLLALAVLSPVFLIVALLIKLDSPGPVLFKQERLGKNGKRFTMLKFRSMCRDAEEQLHGMEEHRQRGTFNDVKQKFGDGDPRVTRIGRYIRKTSIDELPQLLNILKGDMSIVGPRPLVSYEIEALTAYQRRRESLKPGITCYWQVEGRSLLDEHTRGELDVQYIRDCSFLTDILLIAKTFPVIVTGKGAW